jgi:hypothetical protein
MVRNKSLGVVPSKSVRIIWTPKEEMTCGKDQNILEESFRKL